MSTSSSDAANPPSHPARGRDAALLAWFVAVAVGITWPLGRLWSPQLPDVNDAMFSVWRLAWVAHQLPRDPSSLFDANIFWPAENTLAYSDAMLLLGIAGAPLIWMGVHPVIVHNVLLLASFFVAGYAMARLIRYFTPSTAAALVGGTIYMCAPYRLAHIGHLELLWTGFLPLALLTLYRLLEAPGVRRGLAFGAAVGLQGLCSLYYLVFLVVWLVPVAVLAPLHVRVRWSPALIAAFALAVLTAGALITPYVEPYTEARAELGARADAEVQRYSATPADYLRVASGNRLYGGPARDVQEERSLFPGLVTLTLAAIAVAAVRSRVAIVYFVLGLIAYDLSLGVNGGLYQPLREVLPLLSGFRAPARFSVFVVLALSVLAAVAVDRLLERVRPQRAALATTALLTILLIEFWSAPTPVRAVPLEPSPVDQWLARQPQIVVLEWPLPRLDALWRHETHYQFRSIYHWQPLVNGYSGYLPEHYARLVTAMRDFPSDPTIARLAEYGVSAIVIREQFLPPAGFDELRQVCGRPDWFKTVHLFEDSAGERTVVCELTARENGAGPFRE